MTTHKRRSVDHSRLAIRDLQPVGDRPAPSRLYARHAALALFLLYLAVFPGSTITVALGRVPAWGEWMGGALLLLQGAIMLCWLAGGYGRRGAIVAALVFLLAWGVEYLGVATGFPFGRYRYTEQLQPQLPGAVPLAIPCAWLMVAVGAFYFSFLIFDFRLSSDNSIKNLKSTIKNRAIVATLVLLLDMQIEPVATAINRYWVWLDGGAYYSVPATNFAAWWAVGLAMAAVVGRVLDSRTVNGFSERTEQITLYNRKDKQHLTFYVLRFTFYAIPAGLYLLNTLMFTAINLAWGYGMAGAVGLAILVVSGSWRYWPLKSDRGSTGDELSILRRVDDAPRR
jgi:putative membrane protein